MRYFVENSKQNMMLQVLWANNKLKMHFYFNKIVYKILICFSVIMKLLKKNVFVFNSLALGGIRMYHFFNTFIFTYNENINKMIKMFYFVLPSS